VRTRGVPRRVLDRVVTFRELDRLKESLVGKKAMGAKRFATWLWAFSERRLRNGVGLKNPRVNKSCLKIERLI